MKPRVVSGMRPTGKLHLGHLVGALNNWASLQEQYDCFYFVADWHALTSDYANTSEIVANAYDMAADWIAADLIARACSVWIDATCTAAIGRSLVARLRRGNKKYIDLLLSGGPS
jgi:tryptophanyl-tRNA synthetase